MPSATRHVANIIPPKRSIHSRRKLARSDWRDGDTGDSVSKTTFVVLVKDKDEDTGKADQARKMNSPLMTPEEFIKKYFT